MSEEVLDDTVEQLGVAYEEWKEWEQAKNHHKDQFFKLANAAITKQGLATRVVEYASEDTHAVHARALLHNPGWKIVDSRAQSLKPGWFHVTLEEDPAYKPFSHEFEGVKYSRQVSRGAVMVDDNWLQEENPALYEQITYTLPWGERIVRPVDLLGDLLPALTKYIYNAKPKVSLAAPRQIESDV